ncbi:MAG TPA: nickel pincer cofactor biosynthesis protein LarB [Candidatus Saccharimonadales bacterium]|nr:nickel pincer cofactor biosynthesis protein LarB [Candidatus Saccharimonadales bacterium]
MNEDTIRRLLRDVAKGKLRPEEALASLRDLPFKDLGFARYDTHRALRRGFPEVILAEGKTEAQVVGILRAVAAHGNPILVTRARPSVFTAAVEVVPQAEYHPEARAITVAGRSRRKPREGLLIVAAGTSDIPVAEEAAVTAEIMGNRAERLYDVGVAGLHRLLAESDRLRKARVVVAVAGMEGALPGVIAAMLDVPVIGVPVSTGYGAAFGGVTALLSMLNACASGLTVVNIDNGFGAAYAAGLILSGIQKGGRGRSAS